MVHFILTTLKYFEARLINFEYLFKENKTCIIYAYNDKLPQKTTLDLKSDYNTFLLPVNEVRDDMLKKYFRFLSSKLQAGVENVLFIDDSIHSLSNITILAVATSVYFKQHKIKINMKDTRDYDSKQDNRFLQALLEAHIKQHNLTLTQHAETVAL